MTMHVDVAIGGSPPLVPSHAIMVFAPRTPSSPGSWTPLVRAPAGGAYAEISRVRIDEDTGAISYEPWEPATMEFVTALAQGLGVDIPREVLPANILCRTREVISWWSPPQMRTLFFGSSELEPLSGEEFPVPGLVWRLDLKDNRLWVRAFLGRDRPQPGTPLFVAPFLNVYDESWGHGLVCQGTMKRPGRSDVTDLRDWEEGFFAAAGASQLAARATARKGGLPALFKSLAGKKRFPASALTEAGQTVAQFIGAE